MQRAIFRRGAVALVLLAASGGFASEAPSIDPASIRRRVEVLASDRLAGRATGSEGADEAARYVAGEFRSAGLKPLGTSRQSDAGAPPDGSGYFQPFLFTAGVAAGKGNFLSATHSGSYFEFRLGTEYAPASVSGSGRAEGSVAFAGYGIVSTDPVRDDYGGLDVRGKIVVLLAGSPDRDPKSLLSQLGGLHHKVLFARDRGAAAVLVAPPRETGLPDPAASRNFSDGGIPVLLVRRSVAQSWLATAGWALPAAEARLAREPLPLALPVRVSLSADVVKVHKAAENVAGLLEGSDPVLRDEYVVIGAHYDHLGMGGPTSRSESGEPAVHPGADDNASGTAGLIALAQDLAARSPRPKRSIVFLSFSGEELGLLGSSHYVAHPLVPAASTVAMINMDMIGRLRDRRVLVIGVGTSPAWLPLLTAANRASNTPLVVQRSERGFGSSDQQSFYLAKIPVLLFFTGPHSDYHRPSDTAEKINAEGESEVLGLVERSLLRVADAASRPAFQELPPDIPTVPKHTRVWFGAILHPSTEGDVVKLAGVRAGSPAEKAGLRAGDVVVRFGGHDIRNDDDYTIAVSEGRPGERIEVVILRDGSWLSLHAVLEAPPP